MHMLSLLAAGCVVVVAVGTGGLCMLLQWLNPAHGSCYAPLQMPP